MENRRPPRPNSSGRKSYFDRGRGPTSGFRDRGSPGDSSIARPHHPRKDRDSFADGNRFEDPYRRDGRPTGRGFKPRTRKGAPEKPGGRFGPRAGDSRGRGRQDNLRRPEEDIRITSDSQITDGKFRGRSLQNSDSPKATHTKRKLREVAFRIISRRIKAGRILDLGAGSGTIGIEAVSRGAMLVTFVERSARMCSFIRKNLTELGIKDGHGEVVEMEILPYLKSAWRKKRCWDVVYFDLPDTNERAGILAQLGRGRALRPGGLLLIQHESKDSYPDTMDRLKRWRTVDQGETILSIYERI